MSQSKSKTQVSTNKTNKEYKQAKCRVLHSLENINCGAVWRVTMERQNGFTISPVRVGVHLLKTVMQMDRFNIYFSWHLKLEHVDFNFNGLEQSKLDIP